MGANSSSISELSTNEALTQLAGTTTIDSMDPYWNKLLSFSIIAPTNSADAKLLEEATISLCKTLETNNQTTQNFGSLVRNFLMRCSELKFTTQTDDNFFTQQSYNALFIIRCVCKYLMEHLSEECILKHFTASGLQPFQAEASQPGLGHTGQLSGGVSNTIEDLLCALMELIIDVPVIGCTYGIHVEAINTLLTLLSIQMYQPQPASSFHIYRFLMNGSCAIHACMLMKALLNNFIDQVKCPTEFYKRVDDSSSFYKISATVATGIWTMLTLGMGRSKIEPQEIPATLANQSLLLMLVLANHCTHDRNLCNPYRQALFSFSNSQGHHSTSPTRAVATFRLDFSKLYTSLCDTLRDDQTTLLLYSLLHQNTHMKAYLLSRTNLEVLVLPILRILYDAPDRNSHHIYMALIILLILSEDDYFNKAVHEIAVTDPSWFKERHLAEVSLGGLVILVVIRTIQYNMTRMRDKYLHTNCLAALANMSSMFVNLHPYVAQRIVSLFGQLSRKHQKMVGIISESAPDSEDEASLTEAHQENIQDLSVLEEVLRMVLEIINSCLSSTLQHNINLLYTLLHQKELFTPFRTHPSFQDIIQNIDTVLAYFTSHLEENGLQVSPAEVYMVITQSAVTFRRDRLKKFPELKFKYVEEESPEEFFIPYIWSLVCQASHLYFNPQKIILFSLTS